MSPPIDDNAPPHDDADLGAPVEELRALSLPLAQAFPDRVRGRIERRMLTGELIDMAWTAPLAVLLELLRVPFEFFTTRRRP